MRLQAIVFKILLTASVCVGGFSTELAGVAEESSSPAAEPISTAKLAEQFAEASDRDEQRKLREQLIALGERAINDIYRQADNHENPRVRLRCYELLSEEFGDSEIVHERLARDGVRDPSDDIRYHCAFAVGQLKIYAGHRNLRRLMDDPKQPEHIRRAATKSLAELGEPDVIKRLIEMMQHDRFMPRHMGNLGAKALTGRDLEDFNGYKYGEGAFVSGVEYSIDVAPEHYHTMVAKRHQALADYCSWLAKERAEIYKHIGVPW
ncbi:MAG: hypothetical protein C0485_08155 [Pirellula sp.]|nr:hypothetical protein [Pirellula sp.]